MNTYTLYVKTHRKTGLKYLGNETNLKTLKNGTHSFLRITQISWCCLCCNKEGKGLSTFSMHTKKCITKPMSFS